MEYIFFLASIGMTALAIKEHRYSWASAFFLLGIAWAIIVANQR